MSLCECGTVGNYPPIALGTQPLYQRWLPPPSASACVQPTFAPASVHVRLLHTQNPNRATPGELPTPTTKSPASKGLLPPCCAVLQGRCTPAAGKSGPGIFAHSHSRPTRAPSAPSAQASSPSAAQWFDHPGHPGTIRRCRLRAQLITAAAPPTIQPVW